MVKKGLFFILLFISIVVLLIRFSGIVIEHFPALLPKAGIRVEANLLSQVFIDGKNEGKTPLQKEDLLSGEHLLEVDSDQGSWRGYIKLNAGTLTVVNRELAASEASSSGEVITLERGKGASVVSTPSGADVTIDGNLVGKTPLSIGSISSGEHLFLISHPNYLQRSVRAAATDGYSLNLNVDLAISEADLTTVPTVSIPATTELVVTQTPTGFLNVRDSAGLNGEVVERVSVGETLTLEQEQDNWDKVKLPDGKEGYVATQYVQKKTQ